MKEVEVLMRVIKGANELEEGLRKIARFVGEVQVADQYYHDPLRNGDYFSSAGTFISSLRLRQKDDKAQVAHKQDHFDEAGSWIYSDELETEVGDHETFERLIAALGHQKLVRVEILKKTFLTDEYEIVLEEVKDLGIFVEVEALRVSDEANIADVKDKIRKFLKSLGVEGNEEACSGKPELLWLQQNKKRA